MSYADTLNPVQATNFNQPAMNGEFHIPALRRDVPAGYIEQSVESQAQEAYVQQGLDQLQAFANDPRNATTSSEEIEDAILTPQQRAEKEAQWNLDEAEEVYHPEVFDQMNKEAHHADSYYTQTREAVAPAQHVESQTFTIEMARLSIEQRSHLERSIAVARRIQFERGDAASN